MFEITCYILVRLPMLLSSNYFLFENCIIELFSKMIIVNV